MEKAFGVPAPSKRGQRCHSRAMGRPFCSKRGRMRYNGSPASLNNQNVYCLQPMILAVGVAPGKQVEDEEGAQTRKKTRELTAGGSEGAAEGQPTAPRRLTRKQSATLWLPTKEKRFYCSNMLFL